ncbi:hypothetical protein XENOCAPTIV_026452 [Xenoophorus captivus]|uniref:Uncharacterized protein n=1 Tax=Xenoophorus captivus TaxID=1517983 RepID=A0ABV0QPG2_9TELE
MLKPGAAKGGLPKPGLQERVRQASLTSPTSTSATLKNSRSSNTLASDQRLSKLKRASSDDALTKPALGAAAVGSRMKKTVTTGGISDLAEARPRSLSGRQSTVPISVTVGDLIRSATRWPQRITRASVGAQRLRW